MARARKGKSRIFPIVLLLFALVAASALFVYLLFLPGKPGASGGAEGAGNSPSPLEFEFYERLRENLVEVNSSPSGDSAADQQAPTPEARELEQLVEQLTPPSEPQPDAATEALDQLVKDLAQDFAQEIAEQLETPVPDRVAPPEPLPAPPVEPKPVVLASPAPDIAPGQPGTILQSGAFRQQRLAAAELERQRRLGLDVRISERPGQGGPMFLIQSGPYPSQEKLEEAELVYRVHNIATARHRQP